MSLSLDLTQPAGQIAAALLFLIPGLITTWVMERLVGRATPTGTERLLRAVAWSVLVYVVSSPWLLPLLRRIVRREEVSAVGLVASVSAAVFITPTIVGLAVVWLRRREFLRFLLRRLTPVPSAPTAWDFLFVQPRTDFIRLRLKDGTLVGGWFGEGSFASSYPQPQDLYVEEAWRLDSEGSFVEPVANTHGILIRQDTVSVVEFISSEEMRQDGSH
jgi:amino acid transporter